MLVKTVPNYLRSYVSTTTGSSGNGQLFSPNLLNSRTRAKGNGIYEGNKELSKMRGRRRIYLLVDEPARDARLSIIRR